MPRQIRHIEVYLPLDDNDGTPIAESKFVSFADQLVSRYGGYTATQKKFPLQGIWRSEDVVYQDRVMVFSVMDFSKRTEFETLRQLQNLKTRLKKQFDQLEILITLHPVTAI
jgi:hypothetical protein